MNTPNNPPPPQPTPHTAATLHAQESVRYRIRHTTQYRYSQTVAVCQNQIRMQPVDFQNVTCHRSSVTIEPVPAIIHEHRDYFGNRTQTFSIESIHKTLSVRVDSEVSVNPPNVSLQTNSDHWESYAIQPSTSQPAVFEREFTYRSPRIQLRPQFENYARECFDASPSCTLIHALDTFAKRIHEEFTYSPDATDVGTTTEEAFEKRAGVCQDFAHVAIACLRCIGLPARYVSGYLRTIPPPGKERLVGADESHAWIDVYGGETLGWIGIDPTNACFVKTDHIPICVGRDYNDVTPMRGVVLGGGQPSLKVSVDVEPITPPAAPR